MNTYQLNTIDCIDEKLKEHAITEARPITDLHIIYHNHIRSISTLFVNPEEHYTKILVLAYNKTIKK